MQQHEADSITSGFGTCVGHATIKQNQKKQRNSNGVEVEGSGHWDWDKLR